MEMFNRHNEMNRVVEEIPGGVRTTTESNAPELVAQLQAHVSSMYSDVGQGAEVMCMSGTLPTLFRHAVDYQRQLTFTPKGVVAVETSSDPDLTQVIRAHAVEVTGFVNEGMPAMMGPMMGSGGMMGPRPR
jgi:DNA-binding transcriptional MocR family regulator